MPDRLKQIVIDFRGVTKTRTFI